MTKTLCEVSESQKLRWAAPCEQPSNLFTGHTLCTDFPLLSGDQSLHKGPVDSQVQDCCPGAHRPAERAEHAGQQPLSVGRIE